MKLPFPPFVYPFVAFVICYGVLMLLLARGTRLPLDIPNKRSLHARPVPRVGGLGLVSGVSAAMLLLQPQGMSAILVIALCLSMVSWLDDLRGLPVQTRLSVQLLAVAAFVLLTGRGDVFASILVGVGMVWMTNLFNFMDGTDGLAGGMAVSGFGASGMAAWAGGGGEMAIVCFSIAAAALAFLRFNFAPAKLFLGDSGSIPLGFLAAGLGWLGWRDGLWPPVFPLLVFSPFIVDATATLSIRLMRGERIWQAHRDHYYQRLVRMGCSHRRLALFEYVVMLSTALSGLVLVYRPDWQGEFVLVWAMFFLLTMIWIDRRWRSVCDAR